MPGTGTTTGRGDPVTTTSGTAAGAGTLADLRAAQRSSHDVFRALVDTLSHPGRPVSLPAPPSSVPSAVLPVLALADLQTALAIVGDDELAPSVHRATGAPEVAPGEADLVAALRPDGLTGRLVDTLRIGSAHAPELGARVVAAVEAIGAEDDLVGVASLLVRVSGPGASAGRAFRVSGLDPAALRALDRRNEAYPAGIDTWLVDRAGRLVAVPRSNRIEVVTEGAR